MITRNYSKINKISINKLDFEIYLNIIEVNRNNNEKEEISKIEKKTLTVFSYMSISNIFFSSFFFSFTLFGIFFVDFFFFCLFKKFFSAESIDIIKLHGLQI